MSFIGVVLAGGQSRRMKMDKALLEINGQSMLERIMTVLNQAGAEKTIVSRNEKRPDYIQDIYTNKGPLSGIHAALSTFPQHDLLFVPVDLPLLLAEDLKGMVVKSANNQCSCRFEGHSLPLYLKNDASILHKLECILSEERELSVKGFCRNLDMFEISIAHSNRLLNSNTVEQWQYANQLLINNGEDHHESC